MLPDGRIFSQVPITQETQQISIAEKNGGRKIGKKKGRAIIWPPNY
jgi:hypothetical protein